MAFDKETYWKRRNNTIHLTDENGEITATIKRPLRGRDYNMPIPELTTTPVLGTIDILGKTISAPRSQRRQRTIDRNFTKKGFKLGVKMEKKRV